MRFFFSITLLALVIVSCKNDPKTNKEGATDETEATVFNDSSYVLNNDYPVGDVRRYGVFPDSSFLAQHPFTKETKMKTILDIAENHDVELFFPKGNYRRALILDSRIGLKISFDNAEFDLVHITNNTESKIRPKDIELKGTIITYDRLGITEAENISIDSVIIKSDITKNIKGMRSRGCHIYYGCKGISIKYLEIDDFGSGDVNYQHNHAALAIDGWNNNPENVQIQKVHIKSTDRHGIYITGTDHLIGEVIIDRFGVGSSKDMSPMQDAVKGEEKEFKALWINKSYNSFIENITINEKDSKGKYTAHFDAGDKTRPFTIGTFKVINDNPKINILEEDNNGVIIEIKQ